MEEQKIPWYVSSTGDGISLRVKSFLIGILPAILLVLKLSGYEISNEEAGSFINIIALVVSAFVTILASIYHMKGWARRNFYKTTNQGKFMK